VAVWWQVTCNHSQETNNKPNVPRAASLDKHQVTPHVQLDQAAPIDHSSQGPIWSIVDPSRYKNLPTRRADISEATLISLNFEFMADIKVGDKITIPIPQVEELLYYQVDKVVLHSSGSRSWHAHSVDNSRLSFVLTSGSHSTFATVITNSGVFNVKGNKQLAWVVSSSELNRQIDPMAEDYFVVEPKRNQG
jgi:hypothetical protein